MGAKPKEAKNSKGVLMHFSVGAVIKIDGKYLLIDRSKEPFGFAGLAGHVDEGETPEEALVREVMEESGLGVISYKLLFEEEVAWNYCSAGVKSHYWYLYACEVKGKARKNEEAKFMEWYTPQEIKNLKLEPVWKYWFKKLGVLREDRTEMKKIFIICPVRDANSIVQKKIAAYVKRLEKEGHLVPKI